MKNKMLLAMFCILSLGLNAASIKGKVLDRNDNENLTGVKISFINTKSYSCYDVYSDFDGNYELNVPTGDYIVTLYSISYEPIRTYVLISSDFNYNFKLSK